MQRVSTLILPLALGALGGLAAPAVAQGSATTKSLTALENDWARGVVRRDTALFRRLLDPRFVYTEDSTVMNAEQVVASIRDGDPVTRATNSDMTIHDHGSVAVVTGTLRLEGRTSSGPFDRRYRFTDTWLRRGESWRIIAAQDYLIPR